MVQVEVGRVIANRYRLVRVLGAGGMGTVFQAEHVRVRRSFALKFLHPDVSVADRSLKRFQREAELMGRLDHENIVGLIDIGMDDALGPFLVLEYIRGVTLRSEIQRRGVRPLRRLVPIIEQIARALAHAHSLGVIHRDLKPDNVMLTKRADGEPLVKLLDFGVARLRAEGAERITLSDAAIGTAAYMAPEQARGDQMLDARTDVYALGVIAYEALSGTLPYSGTSYNQTLFQILHRTHRPLAELRPDLPATLVAAVERALSKDADQRFPSAEELARHIAESVPMLERSSLTENASASTEPEGAAISKDPKLRVASRLGRLRIWSGAALLILLGIATGYAAGVPRAQDAVVDARPGSAEEFRNGDTSALERAGSRVAIESGLPSERATAPLAWSSSLAVDAPSEARVAGPTVATNHANSASDAMLVTRGEAKQPTPRPSFRAPLSNSSTPNSRGAGRLHELQQRGYVTDNPYVGVLRAEVPGGD